MRSQRNYEKDERFPDAAYLAAIAAAGADVRYIITGDRDGPPPLALSTDEQVLVDGYRALDKRTQRRVLAFILSPETKLENGTKSQPGVDAGGTVHSHVKQQINAPVSGGVAGRDLVTKGRKKKNEAGDQQ